jgi:CheY-like chemotaxis protein
MPLRVLIVDDHPDAATVVSEELDAAGYVTRPTKDPYIALSIVLDGFIPDVALLDLGLPKMNGFELTRRLRQLPQLKETRFVALTAFTAGAHREQIDRAGFDAYLLKPIDVRSLIDLLEEAAHSRTHSRSSTAVLKER